MLPGRSASKVLPSDNDRVFSFHGINVDVAGGVEIIRETDQCIATEFLVFIRLRWHQCEVFGRDDLISVDVLVKEKDVGGGERDYRC